MTERDVKILNDLVRYRTLSVNQIRRLYFSGSRRYVYKRLRELKQRNLVRAYPYVSRRNGRKQGACYYITTGGMRALGRSDLWRASRNFFPRMQHRMVLRAEIYTVLSPLGWEWLDSRDAKKLYRLNRNDILDGVLKSESGNSYAVYITGENPRKQTIEAIEQEISRNQVIGELRYFIVLCENPATVRIFQNHCDAGLLMVMPYREGLELLRINRGACTFLEKIIGEHPRYETAEPFADYWTTISGRDYYVSDCIYNNLVTKYTLKHFTRERSLEEKKGVIVLALERQVPELMEEFKAYPHFKWQVVRGVAGCPQQ